MKKFKFNKKTNNLFKAILALDSVKEAKQFFRDLCTIQEIKDMSERWEIVQLLNKGISYRKIANRLNVSTTTVNRVALWLNSGKGGYQLVLNKLNHSHNSSDVFKKD